MMLTERCSLNDESHRQRMLQIAGRACNGDGVRSRCSTGLTRRADTRSSGAPDHEE
jgi:hypothetical protein